MKVRHSPRSNLTKDRLQKEALCAQLLRAVALVTGETANIRDTIQGFLRKICDTTRWPVAHTRILSQHDVVEERLPADIWYVASGERFEPLRQAINANGLRGANAWHVRMLKTARPIMLSDLAQEPDFSGRQAAHDLGLKSALGIPVLAGERLKAVCEFFSYDPIQGDGLWEEVMASIAAALARTIEHRWFQQSLNAMRGKLLNLQDAERRRLARELHDSTGQNISLIIINMDTLERENPNLAPAARARLAECGDLARKSLQEIRTFSYLLHPPMLDEFGVITALRVFVEGFSERSGIAVDLDLPERAVRLPRDLEVTIFRVVQESLSNVHKHSHSATAKVRMSFDRDRVALTVEDEGSGLPRETEPGLHPLKIGVGIGGMLERVKQCGGQLKLSPRSKGTQLEVSLPLPELAKAVHA